MANAWGWRESLTLSGGIGLVTAVIMVFLIPRDSIRQDFAMELGEIRRIVANRWLFLGGVGMFGVTGLSSLVTAFMVFYLQGSLDGRPYLPHRGGVVRSKKLKQNGFDYGLDFDRKGRIIGVEILNMKRALALAASESFILTCNPENYSLTGTNVKPLAMLRRWGPARTLDRPLGRGHQFSISVL